MKKRSSPPLWAAALPAAFILVNAFAYRRQKLSFMGRDGGEDTPGTVYYAVSLTKLTIKPDVIDPEDAEMLQDLVISAVNEALRQADDAMNSSMSSLTGGLNIPGLGL